MRITDIRTMRLTGPDPHGIGGRARAYSFLLVRVDTDAGVHGLGEALAFAGVAETIEGSREWLVGRDPLDIGPSIRGLLYGALPGPNGSEAPLMSSTSTLTGPPAWASAGIDMALWDIAGKALDVPVATLLGGRYRDRVRVYLDRSGVADPRSPQAWRTLGERAVADGFDWLKLDLEQIAPDFQRDAWSRQLDSAQLATVVELVMTLRDAVGPGVDIAIDGHFAFDVESSVRAAEALAVADLRWLEDPVPISSARALAQVRAASAIPIAAGETFTAEQFRLFIEADAIDIAHPDVLFAGGLAEIRRIATLTDLAYLPLAFHDNGAAVATIATAHAAAASPGAIGMEYHFFDAGWVGEVVRREDPLFDAGSVCIGDAPGFGITLDERVCREHLAAGESVF